MNFGDFYYPMPVNEPVLSYAPGSKEKATLKAVLKELKSTKVDVPMYIGNEEVRTGKTIEIRPPHERKHLLGQFHVGEAKHVTKAINAALKVKDKWANMSWENRSAAFKNILALFSQLMLAHLSFTFNAALIAFVTCFASPT